MHCMKPHKTNIGIQSVIVQLIIEFKVLRLGSYSIHYTFFFFLNQLIKYSALVPTVAIALIFISALKYIVSTEVFTYVVV